MTHKWFKAAWPFELNILLDKMNLNLFSEQVSEGYLVDKYREGLIEGRYIQRLQLDEENQNPFGKKELYKRTLYKSTSFVLSHLFPQIELTNGTELSRSFFASLSLLCDFKLPIAPIQISLERLLSINPQFLKDEIKVTSIQVSDIQIAKGVVGKAVITSEDALLLGYQSFIQARKNSITKLRFSFLIGNKRGYFDLTNTARCITSKGTENSILPELRKYIFDFQSQ